MEPKRNADKLDFILLGVLSTFIGGFKGYLRSKAKIMVKIMLMRMQVPRGK